MCRDCRTLDKGPTVVENVLTPDEVRRVLAYCQSTKWPKLAPNRKEVVEAGISNETFWEGRIVRGHDVEVLGVRYLMLYKRELIKRLIHIHYDAELPLYSDTLDLVRWLKLYELRPHADNSHPNGEPNQYPWREFASVTYLSDSDRDYKGGQVYFPQWEFESEMKPGSVCIAPGGLEHMHGVREVTEGVRYTIASFYTHDKTKADRDDR